MLLEHRGAGGVRPHRGAVTALRNQVLHLAPRVTHLTPQTPLSGPLRYLSGMHPQASYQDPTMLTATLRFRARWRMSA